MTMRVPRLNIDFSRFLVALTALTVSITSNLEAGGPNYSRFGIGDLSYYGSSRTDAMGGAGIALMSDGFINRLNPAALRAISRTRISAGFDYTHISSMDARGSGTYRRGAFKGVAFGIPLDGQHGIGLLLESSPYSVVNYATEATDDRVQQTFYGSGGLSVLGLGTSYAPDSLLTFGAKLNYLHGRIRQVNRFDFFNADFTDGEVDRSDYYSGFNLTLGAIWTGAGRLFNAPSLEPLSLGVILTTPTMLDVDRTRLLITNQISDTTFTGSGTVDVPIAFGAGFSYLVASRYYVTGDVFYQPWERASFFGSHSSEIRNALRIGIGFESLPQRDTEAYWSRVAYRAGFYYNSTYYKIGSTPINEFFVTTGAGLPMGPDARLNVGLHAGVRGEVSGLLQRDLIVRLTFSLSASETWFLQFEEE